MNSIVLIVEDERHLADGLRFNLEAEGYQVETVADGATALERLLREPQRFDAVVLDVMLPGIDGFEVAARLRQAGQFLPVLMLTARGRPEDVLRGFESGADDYLPKPFELSILIARLGGLLRRREWLRHTEGTLPHVATAAPAMGSAPAAQEASAASESESGGEVAATANGRGSGAANGDNESFVFDGKEIDFGELEIRVGGRTVRLTLMEAELLKFLIKHEGRVVSRKAMLEEVWNLREDTDTRAIDNFIVRLRRYIEAEPTKPRHLLTVRGVGYRFVATPLQ